MIVNSPSYPELWYILKSFEDYDSLDQRYSANAWNAMLRWKYVQSNYFSLFCMHTQQWLVLSAAAKTGFEWLKALCVCGVGSGESKYYW